LGDRGLKFLRTSRIRHEQDSPGLQSISPKSGGNLRGFGTATCLRMPIHTVHELVVWNRSMELVQSVYQVVANFSDDERFGLTSQLRRAAVSIPSNIAEGWGYGRTGRYVHHLRIARGSGCELTTQLELAIRLSLARAEVLNPTLDQANEVGRMLSGLIRSLEQHSKSKQSPNS